MFLSFLIFLTTDRHYTELDGSGDNQGSWRRIVLEEGWCVEPRLYYLGNDYWWVRAYLSWVLFCFVVLCCVELFYVMLCLVVLWCVVLYCVVLYCVVMCFAELCCIVLYWVVLCWVMSCCIVMSCIVLSCIVMCCDVLCFGTVTIASHSILRIVLSCFTLVKFRLI